MSNKQYVINSPILGILGGLGPAATADFMHRVVRCTPATSDQEHIATIVYSDPSTPDRTEAILRNGEDPLPALLTGIDFLNSAGVSAIALPCNTAHYWYEQLADSSEVPVINMPYSVIKSIRAERPDLKKIGLLATHGTAKAGTYKNYSLPDIELIDLSSLGDEDPVMSGICAVKSGNLNDAIEMFHHGIKLLKQQGVEGLIYGCTEVSVALDVGVEVFDLPAWDSSESLAIESVSLINSQRSK